MAGDNKITILIIDTDVDCRDIISRAFRDNVDIRVIDTAPNGNIGLIKALHAKPEVILLDAALSDYEPADLMEKIFTEIGPCGIILTVKDGAGNDILVRTLKTLEAGAFDLIVKPAKALSDQERINQFIRKLVVRIRGYSIRRYSRIALQAARKEIPVNPNPAVDILKQYTCKKTSRCRALVMGVSTGGPKALFSILPMLPEDFPLPLVIVIHLPGFFTAGMAAELDKISACRVSEAEEGEILQPGHIYISHGGRHLFIRKEGENRFLFAYSDDPPVNNCRPSVDVLFKSAAAVFRDKAIGVVLTGMGIDGADGTRQLKAAGSVMIAQDKETSVVWGMPGAAVETGCIDYILPLEGVIPKVLELI